MSKLVFPSKPVIAVDWDGTCVPHLFPQQPGFLPGAADALKQLTHKFKVYIWTARISPVVFGDWGNSYPEGFVEGEVAYIRNTLDEAGLKSVGIWTEAFKLPAVLYIDDRGVHFDGDWNKALAEVGNRTGTRFRNVG